MSKECDKPRNPENVTCRNCEEMGHFSRDCPKPRDYSKVKCTNCEQSMLASFCESYFADKDSGPHQSPMQGTYQRGG